MNLNPTKDAHTNAHTIVHTHTHTKVYTKSSHLKAHQRIHTGKNEEIDTFIKREIEFPVLKFESFFYFFEKKIFYKDYVNQLLRGRDLKRIRLKSTSL